jgi:hypothetical protein
MINVPVETHLTFDVPVGTLLMAYVSFEMCLTLAMIYFLIKMQVTPHVPFETLAMAYIFIKKCLVPHVPSRILTMVYILIKMHLALHVPFITLAI